MSKVVIIGGGVIGLFSAYYLAEQGFEVTVLDKGDLSDNCSLGNAGMIVPSHLVPLASPGMIAKGVKWMFSSTSPFYIHPRLNRQLIRWCLLFYKNATSKHVNYSIPYLKNLSLLSKSLYLQLAENHPEADLGLEEKGLLMLYKTAEVAHEEKEAAHVANMYGIKAQVLTPREVQALEPHLQTNVTGGVFYPGDAHLHPKKLNDFLVGHLEQKGVNIQRNTEVLDFVAAGSRIKNVLTNKGEVAADYVVVCAGSWSGDVARKLKISLPMLSGKGYSFMTDNTPAIQRPAILVEGRVAVTPFGDKVRFGGTMEITDPNHSINMKRVRGIYNSINQYYSNMKCTFPEQRDVWSGLRPCSPDGLPYLGFTQRWDNVLFGTGHGMMGISLAPATGKLLAEQLLNQDTSVLVDAFSPDRYN